MARLLAVGIATLDIINTVDHYPAEDEELRASAQAVRRGGNAANTLAILNDMGHECHFAGTLADDMAGQRIEQDLSQRGIHLEHCHRVGGSVAPTSYITLNAQNGSRTIVHYRRLPEYDFGSFADVPVAHFDWLHFEGRNVDETRTMIEYARSFIKDQPISVEIEKEREDIDQLFGRADVLMFSRPFARGRGFEEPEAFLQQARQWAPQAAVITVTWGEQGAWGMDKKGRIFRSPAFPPHEVVDTVGAGDTFNAGLIAALVAGQSLESALESACRLAGRKVGQAGFEGLVESPRPSAGQVLCRLAEIEEPGAKGFSVEIDGRERSIFVVRREGEVFAYLNDCPHVHAELNWQPDEFLDNDKKLIQCSVHMALFEIDSGYCVAGPCAGDRLTPLDVTVEQGQVILRHGD